MIPAYRRAVAAAEEVRRTTSRAENRGSARRSASFRETAQIPGVSPAFTWTKSLRLMHASHPPMPKRPQSDVAGSTLIDGDDAAQGRRTRRRERRPSCASIARRPRRCRPRAHRCRAARAAQGLAGFPSRRTNRRQLAPSQAAHRARGGGGAGRGGMPGPSRSRTRLPTIFPAAPPSSRRPNRRRSPSRCGPRTGAGGRAVPARSRRGLPGPCAARPAALEGAAAASGDRGGALLAVGVRR